MVQKDQPAIGKHQIFLQLLCITSQHGAHSSPASVHSKLSQSSMRHAMCAVSINNDLSPIVAMQKVRELDTAQSRIHDTLQRINLTVDRSGAVDGIK